MGVRLLSTSANTDLRMKQNLKQQFCLLCGAGPKKEREKLEFYDGSHLRHHIERGLGANSQSLCISIVFTLNSSPHLVVHWLHGPLGLV